MSFILLGCLEEGCFIVEITQSSSKAVFLLEFIQYSYMLCHCSFIYLRGFFASCWFLVTKEIVTSINALTIVLKNSL